MGEQTREAKGRERGRGEKERGGRGRGRGGPEGDGEEGKYREERKLGGRVALAGGRREGRGRGQKRGESKEIGRRKKGGRAKEEAGAHHIPCRRNLGMAPKHRNIENCFSMPPPSLPRRPPRL